VRLEQRNVLEAHAFHLHVGRQDCSGVGRQPAWAPLGAARAFQRFQRLVRRGPHGRLGPEGAPGAALRRTDMIGIIDT
jgi:hypothetical protein